MNKIRRGRSGTGKELIARAIHKFSARNHGPFVAIDCGAIPPNLVESELFGYEKGAFTGANKPKTGIIEEANGGTLFVDEVASLPVDMQAKFMRVLQEDEIRPVGGTRPRTVDVRIVSASSSPLLEMVARQQFREDLFYRLHVYPIHVPTLSERRVDVPLLASHFLTFFSRRQGKHLKSFHGTILDFMKQLPWPGNVRELENFIERLVTLSPTKAARVDPGIIPPDLRHAFEEFLESQELSAETKSLNERLRDFEEELLQETLIANDWNQSKAARRLRMSEQNLRYRMKKLGIQRRGAEASGE